MAQVGIIDSTVISKELSSIIKVHNITENRCRTCKNKAVKFSNQKAQMKYLETGMCEPCQDNYSIN